MKVKSLVSCKRYVERGMIGVMTAEAFLRCSIGGTRAFAVEGGRPKTSPSSLYAIERVKMGQLSWTNWTPQGALDGPRHGGAFRKSSSSPSAPGRAAAGGGAGGAGPPGAAGAR